MDQKKCEVFISYVRADYVDAEKNVIPGNAISLIKEAFDEAGITYWLDEEGVFAGDPFASAIVRAIDDCDIFLYISSERSNSSQWTGKEIAIAFAYKKKIIPFRLDQSRYNESVVLYIQDLDHIDWEPNPSKAVSRLVLSVTEYLTRQRRLRAEKEKKEQEKQERIRQEKEQEQADLAVEVELSARELNTDEGKAQDKRRRISRDVLRIEDEQVRIRLIELIDQSGPLHLQQKEERTRFTAEIDSLKDEVAGLKSEVETLVQEKDRLNVMLEDQKKSSIPSFMTLVVQKWGLFAGLTVVLVGVLLFTVVCVANLKSTVANQAYRIAECNDTIKEYNDTIKECNATIKKYEDWILKNAIRLEVIKDYTSIQNPKISLNYTIWSDLPGALQHHMDGNVKLGVQASFDHIKEESYWKFSLGNNMTGTTDVDLSNIVYKLLDKVEMSKLEPHSIPILITFTFHGQELCSHTIRFYENELNIYEKNIKPYRKRKSNDSSHFTNKAR